MLRFFYVEDRTLKRHKSIEVLVVYIDTGSSMPISPSKSRDLAEEFSFFFCGCQHRERKTICLYVYISDIRQIVGYRIPVFIPPFPWHLHITITYDLSHLRL
jgi:hypothetical protein